MEQTRKWTVLCEYEGERLRCDLESAGAAIPADHTQRQICLPFHPNDVCHCLFLRIPPPDPHPSGAISADWHRTAAFLHSVAFFQRAHPVPLVLPYCHADDYRIDYRLFGRNLKDQENANNNRFVLAFPVHFHVCAFADGNLHPSRRQHRHLHHPRRPDVRLPKGEMVQG